jgi:membrane dipeptidase
MDPSTTNTTEKRKAPEPYPGHDETCAKHMNDAMAVHSKHPLLDGHNDLPWALRCCFDMKWSLLNLRNDWASEIVEGCPWRCLHTDIPRLRKGGVGAQLWSVYIPTTGSDGNPLDPAKAIALTLEQIDAVHSMCELYPDVFEMVEKADDIERIFREGRIPSMCGIEGGHQIGGSLRTLRMFRKLGVRYMTLTHNGGPGWADPAVNADGSFCKEGVLGGLNYFGREVVLEMNRIGMTVDLSHVHAETMHAALDATKAPVIFSHSSTRALCRHPRDVPDDVLKRLPQNGGVVMVVFLSKFVAGEFWVAGGRVGATILEVADHVDKVVEVAGIDHVGIGGDYDGGALFARGLEDVSKYPALTCELLKRGYTEEQLGKILGWNVIRVLKECEVVSDRMKASKTPIGEGHWGPELYETNAMQEQRLLSSKASLENK